MVIGFWHSMTTACQSNGDEGKTTKLSAKMSYLNVINFKWIHLKKSMEMRCKKIAPANICWRKRAKRTLKRLIKIKHFDIWNGNKNMLTPIGFAFAICLRCVWPHASKFITLKSLAIKTNKHTQSLIRLISFKRYNLPTIWIYFPFEFARKSIFALSLTRAHFYTNRNPFA